MSRLLPDFETPFIYYPELHFDSARWETCSPLRLLESPWATPLTPAPKKKKRKRILLSPPAAQNLQSAVHAERLMAVSVHAGTSKAAVPCRRPNGRPKLHMCDLHRCLFNAHVRQISYTRGHGRARAEHACVMLKTERRGGED